MKNRKLVTWCLVLISVLVGAWTLRPAFNRPKSVTITASSSSTIAHQFSTAGVDSSAQSQILTGLSNQGYAHLMVVNDTSADISVVTDPSSSSAPSNTTSERLYVRDGEAAAFDDISIHNVLYLQSESGATLTSGKVRVMVW